MAKFWRRVSTDLASYIAAFVFILVCTTSLCLRELVRVTLRFLHGSSVRLMDKSELDPFFVLNPQTPNIVLILKCQRPSFSFSKMVETFDRKISDWTNPAQNLRWIVSQHLNFCTWRLDEQFNSQHHVNVAFVNSGEVIKGKKKSEHAPEPIKRSAQELAEFYLQHKWEDSRPQWEIQILLPPSSTKHQVDSDPKAESRILEGATTFYVVFACHHAYGDGTSVIQLVRNSFADQIPSMHLDPKLKRGGNSGVSKHLSELSFFLLNLPRHFSDKWDPMHSQPKPEYRQNGSKTVRRCSWTQLDLDDLKKGKKNYRGQNSSGNHDRPSSFTTVLVQSIHHSLASMDEEKSTQSVTTPSNKDWIAWTTYSNYPYPLSCEMVNNFTPAYIQVFGPDGVHASVIRSTTPQALGFTRTLLRFSSWLPLTLIRPIANAEKSQVILTNIPGPKESFTILGGVKVMEMIMIPPVLPQGYASICALSYGDKVTIGMVGNGDERVMPTKFLTNMRKSLLSNED